MKCITRKRYRWAVYKKEWKRKGHVTNCSDIQSRDNECCRISQHTVWRRPICKYCWQAMKETKYEFNNYNSSKGCRIFKPIKCKPWQKEGRCRTHTSKIRRLLEEQIGKQHNVWPVYLKYRYRAYSEEDTFLWLSRGQLKLETGSEIIAAWEEALQTKCQQKY